MIIISTISELAFKKIKHDTTVSLGGGHNVFNLAKEISKHSNLGLRLCSPSELTRFECKKMGLQVQDLSNISKIDLAFDGCDSVDYQFNALKSNGGIHLFEKLAAEKSQQYILLLPNERITKILSNKIQLCLEVMPPVADQVIRKCQNLGLKAKIREGKQVSSFARSPLGNLLIDAYADNWLKIDQIAAKISQSNGVVATSYFHNLVTSLITTDQDNQAIEIKKGELK